MPIFIFPSLLFFKLYTDFIYILIFIIIIFFFFFKFLSFFNLSIILFLLKLFHLKPLLLIFFRTPKTSLPNKNRLIITTSTYQLRIIPSKPYLSNMTRMGHVRLTLRLLINWRIFKQVNLTKIICGSNYIMFVISAAVIDICSIYSLEDSLYWPAKDTCPWIPLHIFTTTWSSGLLVFYVNEF